MNNRKNRRIRSYYQNNRNKVLLKSNNKETIEVKNSFYITSIYNYLINKNFFNTKLLLIIFISKFLLKK